MILDKGKSIDSVLGIRFKKINKNSYICDIGNFLITRIFNYIHDTKIQDALCCAKAFYLNNLDVDNLTSTKFDIDVEIAIQLILKNKNVNEVYLNYSRRGSIHGKKLRLKDSYYILKRIFKNKDIKNLGN